MGFNDNLTLDAIVSTPKYERMSGISDDEVNENTSLLAANSNHVRGHAVSFGTPSCEALWSTSALDRRSQEGSHGGQDIRSSRSSSTLNQDGVYLHGIAQDAAQSNFENHSRRHFTTTDRLRDTVTAGNRARRLRNQKSIRSKLQLWSDPGAEFLLILTIGVVTAGIAFGVNVTEAYLFDIKEGHCVSGWYKSKRACCSGTVNGLCHDWKTWSQHFSRWGFKAKLLEFGVFNILCFTFASVGCYITLWSKVRFFQPTETLEFQSLPYGTRQPERSNSDQDSNFQHKPVLKSKSFRPSTYYSAAGSGVAEIKVILSGFLVPGCLGLKTLILKTTALIPGAASGLSLGKEGPFVHIAACVGDVVCDIFSYVKSNFNDTKRREIVSTCAACGVSIAFGAPFAGIFFTIEEADYHITSRTLLRAFLCCVVATSCLKFLDPYGTGEALIFHVTYGSTWSYGELPLFILLGILGGAMGAFFIKSTALWARVFRRFNLIQNWSLLEIGVVAIVTSVTSFWNYYLRLPSVRLIFELASPCNMDSLLNTHSSPETLSKISRLVVALVVKFILSTITVGLKIPAGIYIPSLVLGGLMGRIAGYVTQYCILQFPNSTAFVGTPVTSKALNTIPGVYALIGAGTTLTGVTRLTATTVVVLLELNGNMEYVVPFVTAILCAKWTASAIESQSMYDRLIKANAYPYLDSKSRPVSNADLGDIVPPMDWTQIIDISKSIVIPANHLRQKLDFLGITDEEDGTLPILHNGILRGFIAATELRLALSSHPENTSSLCLLAADQNRDAWVQRNLELLKVIDLTPFIATMPIILDVKNSIDLVYRCFSSLGARCIGVSRDGKFVGLVHRKAFVRYTTGCPQSINWE